MEEEKDAKNEKKKKAKKIEKKDEHVAGHIGSRTHLFIDFLSSPEADQKLLDYLSLSGCWWQLVTTKNPLFQVEWFFIKLVGVQSDVSVFHMDNGLGFSFQCQSIVPKRENAGKIVSFSSVVMSFCVILLLHNCLCDTAMLVYEYNASSIFISDLLYLNCRKAVTFYAFNLWNGKIKNAVILPDITTAISNNVLLNVNFSNGLPQNVIKGVLSSHIYPNKWAICSATQIENITLSDEERTKWEACRQALSAFNFSIEEEDKILGKAFGHIHSPYWSEERKREVPDFESLNEILEYLRNLDLSDDEIHKLLKKFPEVLGCHIEHELRNNVQILEKDWGIEGKSLRNLLRRNPKVLGYNVDCKGDCMAKCTRCWVRF
ncbi:hypothetical protein JRO89_XS07G0256800 [Xanthoceras sorbifolium]|uniref:Uncharacterized protein n=1 Tax=Xanthoceras sorbifolium TaxID=99658 RepID=A0ABQ8HV88_9ROSI|nr:hypothetical protein JRO89_XS07G0256800 [Xanthoceras sorbifolium]